MKKIMSQDNQGPPPPPPTGTELLDYRASLTPGSIRIILAELAAQFGEFVEAYPERNLAVDLKVNDYGPKARA